VANRRHTTSSENYFIDVTYRNITESQSLEMNIKGQIINVLPLVKAQAKNHGYAIPCKIDDPFLINRYRKIPSSNEYMYF